MFSLDRLDHEAEIRKLNELALALRQAFEWKASGKGFAYWHDVYEELIKERQRREAAGFRPANTQLDLSYEPATKEPQT